VERPNLGSNLDFGGSNMIRAVFVVGIVARFKGRIRAVFLVGITALFKDLIQALLKMQAVAHASTDVA